MAIEPTSLSDVLTTPDVPLEPVGNTSGQDFSEFFNMVAGEAPADDGAPTADVGNPTSETGEALEPTPSSPPSPEGPIDALLLIADRLGLTGQGKNKPAEADREQPLESTPEAGLPPGLAGNAKAYGLTHAAPPTARGPMHRHIKAETADTDDAIADSCPASECDHPDGVGQSEAGAQAMSHPDGPALPVLASAMPPFPANPAAVEDWAADDAAIPEAVPPSPSATKQSASLSDAASVDDAVVDLADADAPIVEADSERPARPQAIGRGAMPQTVDVADRKPADAVFPMPPARPDLLKPETPAAADAASATVSPGDLPTLQPAPSASPWGQSQAAVSQPVAQSPATASSPAEASAHQQVLEDLLIGNSVEDQWVDRLSQDLHALISSDNREARLHLRPRELGDLQIKVEMKDGQAKVHFTVETAAAQSFIADATPRLQTMMENRGFRLEQSSVDVGGNGSGKGGHAGQGQQQSQPFMAKAPPSVLTAVARRAVRLNAFERYA